MTTMPAPVKPDLTAGGTTPADRIRRSGFELPDGQVADKAARLRDLVWHDRAVYCEAGYEELIANAVEAFERGDSDEVGRMLRRAAVLVAARYEVGR